MTGADEKALSDILKERFSKIIFIDIYPWPAPNPPVCDSIDLCNGSLISGCAILNLDIVSFERYKKSMVGKIPSREEYHGADIGPGLINVEHSSIEAYGLRHGCVAYSYCENDLETKKFSNDVTKIVRKTLTRVYPMEFETKKMVPTERFLRSYYAGPDAIEKYDQVNGLFLGCHPTALLTSRV